MADLSIKAGATSQSINVDLYILATGAPQTALVYNSTSLTAYYSFTGAVATSTAITLATLASATTAYSSGGFIKLDDTNMPGLYRLDLPDAAIASAKGREVVVTITGFSGMATRHIKIELTGWDNQDAVHGGMSALPNTACTTNASLLTSGTGTAQLSVSSGQVILQTGTGTGQLDFTSGVVKANATQWLGGTIPAVNVTGVPLVDAKYLLGTIFATPATAGIPDVNVKNMNNVSGSAITTVKAVQGLAVDGVVTTVTNQLTAAQIATGLWTDTTAGDFTTALSVGKSLMNGVTLGTGLTVAAVSGAVGSVTGAVGSVTGAVGSVTGLTASNLDTTVSSRMATYTQPAGFLAATFPTGTVANTTNITAGTITTVTNQLTAAAIATGVWTDTTAGDFTTSLSVGKSVMNGVTLGTGLTIAAVSGAVGSVTAGVTVTTNNDKTGYTASTVSDKTGYALTAGERNSIADATLDRDMSTGADSGSPTVRTVRQALRFLRNKWSLSGGTLTVMKEDDTTASWTAIVTTDAAAIPVIGSDPA